MSKIKISKTASTNETKKSKEWPAVVARMQENMEWMNRVVASKPVQGEPQLRIEDINAIKRLQRAYGYYFDEGLWDEMAELFSADATFEMGLDGAYQLAAETMACNMMAEDAQGGIDAFIAKQPMPQWKGK